MVKKVKILPAIAALALGLTSFVGVNKASAYEMHTTSTGGADAVEVCHTLNNIIGAINAEYVFTFTRPSADFDFSSGNVTVVSPSDATISNASATSFTLTMPFVADGSQSTETKCAVLNFMNSFDSDSNWTNTLAGESVTVTESVPSGSSYPASSATEHITVHYGLNVDNNGAPIPATDPNEDYQSLLTVKDAPTFTSAMTNSKTHFEVTKTVKGNRADPNNPFSFSVMVTAKNPGSSADGVAYTVYITPGANSAYDSQTCYVGTSCAFSLKHGQTAKLGYSTSGADELYEGAYSFMVSETPDGYTASYVPTDAGTAGSETSGSSYSDNTLDAGDKVDFINTKSLSPTGRFLVIFPFIILAGAAVITIIAVRKTSAKKDQA